MIRKFLTIACAVFLVSGCDKLPIANLFKVDPADQGSEIVKQNLKSPSSFKKVAGEVVWKGQNSEGMPAYVVSVLFDAANSFGASLRGCMYVAYYETKDGKIGWNRMFGVQDYSDNEMFCSPNIPDSIKKDLAKTLAEINFKDGKSSSQAPIIKTPESASGESMNSESKLAVKSAGIESMEINEVAGPSYDCAKARSYVEKTVCADAELAALDVELYKKYKIARGMANNMKLFNSDTEQAWRYREDNCKDRKCIKQWYEDRYSYYKKQIGE